MRTLVDFLIEKKQRDKKYFKEYLFWAKKIKKEAKKNLKDVRVLLFGSVVKKQAEPGSDIDILVISPQLKNPEKKSEVLTGILKEIGQNSPFEIHLVTPEEYQNWYQKFVKKEFIEV